MSRDDVTVFVSESISDKVDMDQFYDDAETKDINVIINASTVSVSGKLTTFKIDNMLNSLLSVKFISAAEDVSNIMFANTIDSIEFTLGKDGDNIKSFSNIGLLSQQFDIDYKNNQCVYEFIFEIHNI